MADPVDPKRVKDIKIKTGIVKRWGSQEVSFFAVPSHREPNMQFH